MRPIRPSALAALALSCFMAMPCLAQSMKPGLWEINNKVSSGNGQIEQALAQMQQQMAAMPPAERRSMEEMMAKQGVNLSAAGGGMLVKMCVTPEMAARKMVPMQQQGDCTQRHSAMSGNVMQVSFSCSKPPSSGEGQIAFSGDTGYSMKMTVTANTAGKAETMHIDAVGKWLGANCGAIKPIAPPPAR